jgi:CDP-glycerol glycerophosphotransferase
MNFAKKFYENFKYLKFSDIIGICIFIIIFIPAYMYKAYLKIINKKLWVVCEGPKEARENGYYFYKYIREKHPEINAYYAIDKRSKAYFNVQVLGNIIQYGSIKHWVFYLAATKNISSQKSGNPCPPLFYVLHTKRIINGHRIYLGHGVVISDTAFLHYNVTKFELIIAGAKPEHDYFINHFGYTPKKAIYTGLPRFDYLWVEKVNYKQIVIMPTWRDWIAREPNPKKMEKLFLESKFYKYYQNLLNNSDFIKFIESNNIVVYFYPHINMQKFIKYFSSTSENIIIASNKNYTASSLINSSALMISDYSSVTTDFAYQMRPVIYYQFDEEEFRENQYAKGYFDFKKNGFGPVISTEKRLVECIKDIVSKEYALQGKYLDRITTFYPIRDRNNSERIFNIVLNMENLV